ncbi:hypothetical protein [uncultured Microbacterium sp.]|uniref:DUF6992 family protein n=1 Tax=uncultured Microbacterium sp. TaxID=191216 RepID=UPI0025ECD44B|nr:hypothetical protein [uncultured Microbacterium sp.]
MASAKTVAGTLVHRLRRWGTASVVVGGALALFPRTRAFGAQTAMWGAVDVGLAMLAGRRGAAPKRRPLRRLLLINTVLDVGYVAAGAHLAVRTPSFGGRLSPDAARGHGAAVVIQGVALFVLDLTAAQRLRR